MSLFQANRQISNIDMPPVQRFWAKEICHESSKLPSTMQAGRLPSVFLHSKIENSYLEKNSCKILILSNILLKIRKTRENILIKNQFYLK